MRAEHGRRQQHCLHTLTLFVPLTLLLLSFAQCFQFDTLSTCTTYKQPVGAHTPFNQLLVFQVSGELFVVTGKVVREFGE